MPARTSWTSWLSWLPVAVLVAFVVAQAVLMATVSADPQSGSGYAMFSTVDIASTRRVVASGDVAGERVAFEVPPDLQDLALRLRSQPTTAKATQLAPKLLDRRWSLQGSTAIEGGSAKPTSVTVTVWGISANGRTLASNAMVTVTAP